MVTKASEITSYYCERVNQFMRFSHFLWHLCWNAIGTQSINLQTCWMITLTLCGQVTKSTRHWNTLITWWRHQMETFSALLAICAGNSPVNSPHKGQWRWALMFSLICVWINNWVNNRETGDLRRYRATYDVIVMIEDKEWTTQHSKWWLNKRNRKIDWLNKKFNLQHSR